MKIILSNLAYCTNVNGAPLNYIANVCTLIKTPAQTQGFVFKAFNSLLEQHRPDLCCLIEVDEGSWSSSAVNQVQALSNKAYPFYGHSIKYAPNSTWRQIPVTKGKSNGYLATQNWKTITHYIQNGNKTLLYELIIDEQTSIFWFHASLARRVRARQFQEIKAIMRQKPRSVLLGDLNIFKGLSELGIFSDTHAIYHAGATFPAYKPKKILDVMIASKNISVQSITQAGDIFSDHRAIICTLDI